MNLEIQTVPTLLQLRQDACWLVGDHDGSLEAEQMIAVEKALAVAPARTPLEIIEKLKIVLANEDADSLADLDFADASSAPIIASIFRDLAVLKQDGIV